MNIDSEEELDNITNIFISENKGRSITQLRSKLGEFLESCNINFTYPKDLITISRSNTYVISDLCMYLLDKNSIFVYPVLKTLGSTVDKNLRYVSKDYLENNFNHTHRNYNAIKALGDPFYISVKDLTNLELMLL
jgi:hypothetical protein